MAEFTHRAGHHEVTPRSSSSMWDGSRIPHTECNVLEKPMGSTQQKPGF